jgi:hypothetical protein
VLISSRQSGTPHIWLKLPEELCIKFIKGVSMDSRKEIIEQILAIELEMFLTVPTTQKYSCQEHPEGFRLHRRAQFGAWSQATLESYLNDLQQAGENNQNLLTVKYARMENRLPRSNFSPLVKTIGDMIMEGQKRFIDSHPWLLQRGRPLNEQDSQPGLTSFETYLRGELETYSEKTLELLYQDILALQNDGSSFSERVYRCLAEEMGFESLEKLENRLRTKSSCQG